jgi:hypothetical protein
MKLNLLFLVFLMPATLAAQFTTYPMIGRPQPKTNVFIELIGPTGLFAVNADVSLQKQLFLRVGTSVWPREQVDGTVFNENEVAARLFLGLIAASHGEDFRMEFGGGVVFGDPKGEALVPAPNVSLNIAAVFGSERTIFGISLNPLIGNQKVFVMPGIRFGVKL